MASKEMELDATVGGLLEALPSVWDRIRSNLRIAATGEFGISLDQVHTLRHIKKGFRTVRDISDKRQVSRPAISQSVEILVKKGLVTRKRESDDRRLVSLDLTPYARGVMEANWESNRAWVSQRLSRLTVSELKEIGRAMETLKNAFAPDGAREAGASL